MSRGAHVKGSFLNFSLGFAMYSSRVVGVIDEPKAIPHFVGAP